MIVDIVLIFGAALLGVIIARLLWGVFELLFPKRLPKVEVEPDPNSGPWITNVKNATAYQRTNAFNGKPLITYGGNAICVTCGKKMPGCWDTVCAICGDNSCYDHSTAIDGHWYCEKCKEKKKGEKHG